MKGQRFTRRLGFAIAGLRSMVGSEASFRVQLLLGSLSGLLLVVLQPGALWTAIVLLAVGMVLAAEAINAAIEHLADALHPDHHPLIGVAKDAAAGAVLIASVAAASVGVAVVYSCFPYT